MDKVIARIAKLFARSAHAGANRGGATEAEAETAMRLAQELMAKYNLDMAAIETAVRPDAQGAAQRTREEISSRTRYEWQRQLARYVAEAHFCYHLVRTDKTWQDGRENADNGWIHGKYRKKATHVFVGRKANVITAQMMFHYLVDTIEALAPTEDNRVKVDRVGWGTYKGEEYGIKIIDSPDGPRFQRCDASDATTVYDTPSQAAAAIVGHTANGFVFFNLGEASTAESWKKGCADRICERLAKRRQDLIEQHDARVRQAEEDAKAERERRAAEAKAASERVLSPNEQAEANAVVNDLRARARHAALAPTGLEAERPTEGEDDAEWTPGQGAEGAEVPPTTTALVLASAYDASEQEANYELAHGLAPGTLARRRAEREKWEREYEEKQAAREAAGEAQRREEPVRVETEKQRLRREAKEAEELARRRKRWAREDAKASREQEKALAKVDKHAYREGQEKGSGIGLDAQIEREGSQKKIGGRK